MPTTHAPRLTTLDLPGLGAVPCARTGDPDGPAVVLIHGFTDSWRSFEPVVSHLPASIHVVIPTLRGHGDAPRPETGYGIDQLASDTLAAMDAASIDDAVVVGHSLGAAVAARVAVDEPTRVRGAVLIGAFAAPAENLGVLELLGALDELADPVDVSFVEEFQRSTISGAVPDAFFDLVVAESCKLPTRVWRDALNGFVTGGAIDADRLSIPTLLLWGEDDEFTPRTDQDAMRAAAPVAELLVYPGTGHAVHWEQPRRAARDIARFVEALSAIA